MDKATWIGLITAVIAGPLGLALAKFLLALAESINANNSGQNQTLKGLRKDMDQVLAKQGLASVAPKPPPAPRPKRHTVGGMRFPTPLPFFPPKINADAVPQPVDLENTAPIGRRTPPPTPKGDR